MSLEKSTKVGGEIIPVSEQITSVVEDIKGIISLARSEVTERMLMAKFQIGEVITANDLFQKNGKGQAMLYAEVSKQVGMKEDSLRDCVKFFEAFPGLKPEKAAAKAFKDYGSWRDTRIAIYGGDPNAVRNNEEKETDCKHCQIHCKN